MWMTLLPKMVQVHVWCCEITRDMLFFAACRSITYCRDATEAELTAIEEGLRLALHWTSLNFTIETDCADAAELIKGSSPNMSVHAFKISVIRELFRKEMLV
jgi:hypothetical protein